MEIIKKNSYKEYEEFVKNHENGNFMQSLKWTQVKYNWQYECIVSKNAQGEIIGSMLVLIRKMPLGKTLLYSPRGPVCDYNDYDTISDLLSGVKVLAKQYKGYIFKMDPAVLEGDDAFVKAMEKLGFIHTPKMKDFETLQCRKNYMLNIEGKTLEEISMNFHQKWRYNIKVATKKGVECKVCDKRYLDDFYELMKITGVRDSFIIRPKDYFERMMDALGEEHCKLFLCYREGKALSGAITTQYAGKTCYVYGASDNEQRNFMPNHLMQWTMIQWAVENNGTWYDFQGIPHYEDENDPHYGVYRFKKGFNGEVIVFAGEFDYIFNPTYKKLIDMAEKTLKFYKKIYKKLFTRNRDK